jgi:hypothetical protein
MWVSLDSVEIDQCHTLDYLLWTRHWWCIGRRMIRISIPWMKGKNDDLPADLRANIVHFTKTNQGRYGFFPRVDVGDQ